MLIISYVENLFSILSPRISLLLEAELAYFEESSFGQRGIWRLHKIMYSMNRSECFNSDTFFVWVIFDYFSSLEYLYIFLKIFSNISMSKHKLKPKLKTRALGGGIMLKLHSIFLSDIDSYFVTNSLPWRIFFLSYSWQ
jgi:hypothetical protein